GQVGAARHVSGPRRRTRGQAPALTPCAAGTRAPGGPRCPGPAAVAPRRGRAIWSGPSAAGFPPIRKILMQMLFGAHSGVRYLVLLIGIIAVIYYAYAVITKKHDETKSRVLGSVFTGVLDLQGLLGILLVVMGLY